MSPITPALVINIWDDYADDGEGTQSTYAYVEDNDLAPAYQQSVLHQLSRAITVIDQAQSWSHPMRVEFHDSARVYPQLVGTEHEAILFKRWQLFIDDLTHAQREHIVEQLGHLPLEFLGRQVEVISQS